MAEFGIYIHIPFCLKKCKYCDFTSFDEYDENVRKKYIQAILQEIENTKVEKQVTTIYIGGGTPSILEAEEIIKVLEQIKQKYKVANNAEITIEINPGTVDLTKLQMYKKAGINRLSIGLQAVQDECLEMLGRIHCFENFKEVYQNARKTRI